MLYCSRKKCILLTNTLQLVNFVNSRLKIGVGAEAFEM